MRIKANHLSMHLQRQLDPLYFIYGEEPLTRTETIDAIRLAAEKQGFIEREQYEITSVDVINQLKLSLDTIGLFSRKRLIECRINEGKFTKANGDAMVEFIHSLPTPDTILVFIAEKLETSTKKANWFLALESKAVTITANTLTNKELPVWIIDRLQKKGLKANQSAIECLISRTEGNLLSTAQTIEKLCLARTHAATHSIEITEKDILLHSSGDTRFSLFDLVDAALSGSKNRTIQILMSLRNEGIDPTLILWAITREVRNIIAIQNRLQSGDPSPRALREYGVFQHRVEIVVSFLKRCSANQIQLHDYLIQAKNIDEKIKTYQKEDSFRLLLSLALSISGLTFIETLEGVAK